jgi:CoA:oxalate CoA-transferase
VSIAPDGDVDAGRPAPRPLEGVRVLDISRVVSGPFAGRLLADLGADVVRVEGPDSDFLRKIGHVRNGLSGYFTQMNVGKRNIGVDLKRPGGRELVLDLCRAADVVIENNRPGVMERLGLGWADVSAVNGSLIMLSLTGFGQSSSMASRPAYAPVVHSESGLVHRQATFDGVPFSDPVLSIADTGTALHSVIAILAALYLRKTTGVGQYIDMAMHDAMLTNDDYVHWALDGVPVRRVGGEVWETCGGPIMLGSLFTNTWRAVSKRYGLVDGLPSDAPVAEKERVRRALIEEWFRSFEDRDVLKKALDSVNLAWAEIQTQADAVAQPLMAERDMIKYVDDRGGGVRPVINTPYRFSAAQAGVTGKTSYLGEHNAEVLREWRGWNDDDIERLVEQHVLCAEPLHHAMSQPTNSGR